MLTKQCTQCSKTFKIADADLAFYAQIKVPPPTWCPQCRLVRRMVWRNERTLYNRQCDKCHQPIVAIYGPNISNPVYCRDCWYSDKWSPLEYGQDYDFAKPFFTQYHELLQRMPMLNLSVTTVENSTYTNYSLNMKNCYLVFASWECDNSLYSQRIVRTQDTLDSLWLTETQLMYESVYCINCYNLKYAFDCDGCSDSSFMMNCRGCTNCFGCINLRNKEYYWFNKPCTKDEYDKLMQQVNLGSHSNLQAWQKKFTEHVKRYPRPAMVGKNNVASSGNMLRNCNNCKNCFMCNEGENSTYCYLCEKNIKNCYDIWTTMENNELCYELIAGGANNYGSKFCVTTYQGCTNLQYCYTCISSRDSFGCVGLRNNQYCILNKQYAKAEYEQLVTKIIAQMTVQGDYGEFFPPELSLFAYNESVAQQFFPLDRTKIVAQGYTWKESEIKNSTSTILTEQLPDGINQVNDKILKEVIGCAHAGKCMEQCTVGFKIMPAELEFYRQRNLALPRLCPNCRHYQRLKNCPPFTLWHQQCMCLPDRQAGTQIDHQHQGRCPTEFETTQDPTKPELVYCEVCYAKVIY